MPVCVYLDSVAHYRHRDRKTYHKKLSFILPI